MGRAGRREVTITGAAAAARRAGGAVTAGQPATRPRPGSLDVGASGAAPGRSGASGGERLHVAVLDDYLRVAPGLADWGSLGPGVEVRFFHERLGQVELAPALRGFEVLVVMRERTPFPRRVLEQLPRLALLVTTGMRNAALDLACLAERGVVVSGTDSAGAAGAGLPSTAELAWALVLALCKRVRVEDAALRAGRWQLGLPGTLAGSTLGLAGLGNLGAAMVGPARAFGMEVIAWSENLDPRRAGALGVRAVSKAELLAQSDILSIHLVLSERTRKLFGAVELARCKPGALLVNTSRGPIVDEQALIEALASGRLGGAGLDVYDHEPLPAGHPLTRFDNVVLTPHLGYVSERSFAHMYGQAVEDIAGYLAGRPVRLLG